MGVHPDIRADRRPGPARPDAQLREQLPVRMAHHVMRGRGRAVAGRLSSTSRHGDNTRPTMQRTRRTGSAATDHRRDGLRLGQPDLSGPGTTTSGASRRTRATSATANPHTGTVTAVFNRRDRLNTVAQDLILLRQLGLALVMTLTLRRATYGLPTQISRPVRLGSGRRPGVRDGSPTLTTASTSSSVTLIPTSRRTAIPAGPEPSTGRTHAGAMTILPRRRARLFRVRCRRTGDSRC
jgi:hypothetical protein